MNPEHARPDVRSADPAAPKLRAYRGSDLERLVALDRLCFPPEISYSRTDFDGFLRHSGVFCLVAELEGGIGAFILVEGGRKRSRRAGHLLTIDVDPPLRRKRLGAMLLAAAEQRLKEGGIERLRLEVAEENVSARAFYQRSGFVPTGYVPDYYPGGRAAITMEKSL